jgi:hypothetical protein
MAKPSMKAHRSKVCRKCKQRKNLQDFYKHPSHKDGRRNDCIACVCQQYETNKKKPNPKFFQY